MHEKLSDNQIIRLIESNRVNPGFESVRKILAEELVRRFFENQHIEKEREAKIKELTEDTQ